LERSEIQNEILDLAQIPWSTLARDSLQPQNSTAYSNIYGRPGTGLESNLDDELYKWRRVFVGRPALHFLHAATIIALRRRVDVLENSIRFFGMWADQGGFFSLTLDTKWLISAADTILDHSENENERAVALASVVLFKTIKLYETELFARGAKSLPLDNREKVELFDGLLSFSFPHGDLIQNLSNRVEDFCSKESTARLIFKALFNRALSFDTTFRRLTEP